MPTTSTGEWHDANDAAPTSRRVTDLIERGRSLPPLPCQLALRGASS